MKYPRTLIALATICCLTFMQPAKADPQPSPESKMASPDKAARIPSQLESEYAQAMARAEKSQQQAALALRQAREQLQQAGQQQHNPYPAGIESSAKQPKTTIGMQQELSRAQRQLREISREISHLARELARRRMGAEMQKIVQSGGGRPVLGVILGKATDVGIKVLGVSPDGPAEHAGVTTGDVIVALDGHALAAADDSSTVLANLKTALHDIEADEPVIVSVQRADKKLDLSVVPQVREPLSWQSVLRIPGDPEAPRSPHRGVIIERIEVPEIDTEALSQNLEQLQQEIEDRRELVESGTLAPYGIECNHSLNSDVLSNFGDFALQDAGAWFGRPLAEGLQLAMLDAGLGKYFKTGRGVLVIKARPDNNLQLKSGDVVLSVGDTQVDSPAGLMRALRNYEPGDEMLLAIKRDRKSKNLKVEMPARAKQSVAPHVSTTRTITSTTDTD